MRDPIRCAHYCVGPGPGSLDTLPRCTYCNLTTEQITRRGEHFACADDKPRDTAKPSKPRDTEPPVITTVTLDGETVVLAVSCGGHGGIIRFDKRFEAPLRREFGCRHSLVDFGPTGGASSCVHCKSSLAEILERGEHFTLARDPTQVPDTGAEVPIKRCHVCRRLLRIPVRNRGEGWRPVCIDCRAARDTTAK